MEIYTNDKAPVAQVKQNYAPELICNSLDIDATDFVEHFQNLQFFDLTLPDYTKYFIF